MATPAPEPEPLPTQRSEYDRLCKEAMEKFRWRFGDNQNPSIGVYSPGRVTLLGEHTDYNGGRVISMALHLVTVILGRPSPSGSGNCRLITVASTGETGYHEFPVPRYPAAEPWEVESEGPFWATYLKGVVALMNHTGTIPPFDAIIATSVPLGGGLSSSAALEAATCQFIEQLCPSLQLPTSKEKALLCREAEQRYVRSPNGTSDQRLIKEFGGTVDQFTSLMATDRKILSIDCRSHEVCEAPFNNTDVLVLITNSNCRRGHAQREYEQRRVTCASAARKLGKKQLRDVTLQELDAGKRCLDDVEYRRARHVVTEIQRTADAVQALNDGDYKTFGQLMTQSHKSLRNDFEVTCSELEQLVSLAQQDKDGVFGSCMTGAGFGGCTVTLLQRRALSATMQRIEKSYKSRDGQKAIFYVSTPCRGAGVVPQKFYLGKKGRPFFSVPTGQHKPAQFIPPGIDAIARITIGNESYQCKAKDMRSEGELGRGAFGAVFQMRHRHRGTVMAVKKIRATIDDDERRRLMMDVNVACKSLDCPYTVTFFGSLFHDGDVWIFMELMDRCLDQLYKLVYEKLKLTIPEPVVGKMAEATVKALHFLKANLNVLHRDVKPSNILINRSGQVKLCDFGIAAETINSFTKTNIGSKPYLAPERINPTDNPSFDQRSDVWSYGITFYELAIGRFPYPFPKDVDIFKQLELVVEGQPPRVPDSAPISNELRNFIHRCLTKEVRHRPKFHQLLDDPFIKRIEAENTDIGPWCRDILDKDA